MNSHRVNAAKESILIIDHLSDNLRWLSTKLIEQGYEVRNAINSSIALMKIKAASPDLILLATNLPDITGYEICQKLKATPATAHIPIIFLTDLQKSLDKDKIFTVGGADYLIKPFHLQEVLTRIENQLNLNRLQQKLLQKERLLTTEINQHQQTKIALQEVEAKIASIIENKNQHIGRISHELRTPLNTILGFSQLIRKQDNLNSQSYEYLDIITRSSEHLLELVNDLLEISKIEVAKVQLSYNNFDFYAFLQSLEKSWGLQAQSKGLELEVKYSPDLPRYIETDRKKLRQILSNLLDNAIKFTSRGKVNLRVRSEKSVNTLDEYVLISFEVEDTGPGIAADEINQIFQPFVQTEAGRKSEQGTGLGLAISYEFVRLLGGELVVKSQVNQGTIFQFSLQVKLGKIIVNNYLQAPQKVVSLAPNQPQYLGEALNSKALTIMPVDWIVELHNLAKKLDGESIFQLIKQTPSKYAVLVKSILDLVDNFRFDLIVNITEQTLKEIKPEGRLENDD